MSRDPGFFEYWMEMLFGVLYSIMGSHSNGCSTLSEACRSHMALPLTPVMCLVSFLRHDMSPVTT